MACASVDTIPRRSLQARRPDRQQGKAIMVNIPPRPKPQSAMYPPEPLFRAGRWSCAAAPQARQPRGAALIFRLRPANAHNSRCHKRRHLIVLHLEPAQDLGAVFA